MVSKKTTRENRKTYPSMIMLVGEYGVMAGGSALTIPFGKSHPRVSETAQIPPGRQGEVPESLSYLQELFHCMDNLPAGSFRAPLYFREDGHIQNVDFDPCRIQGGYRLFLLDSGQRFDTATLLRLFHQQMEDPVFASSIRNEYLVVNQKLIDTLLGSREADPALLVRVLSDYQFTHFSDMIPSSMLDLWIEGQVSNEYYLKLCGSGGGFMLGITHQTSLESLEERWKQNLIWIE